MSIKLTKPQGYVLFVLLMCAFMSCAMSLAFTFIRFGFQARLFDEWTKAWAIGFVVAVPIAFVAVPVARRITDSVTR